VRNFSNHQHRTRRSPTREQDQVQIVAEVRFYGRMEQVFREHLVRLRGGPEATEP
jgi:hypothetical protein